MRLHQLKLDPLKCAFRVQTGNFLGFLVHQRGVEVDQNKVKAIISAKAPQNKNKNELQNFLGKVNYLRRFISNLVTKTKVFPNLIKLKEVKEFKWKEQHQIDFDGIKGYPSKPLILMPPLIGRPHKLYLSVAKESIGCLLAQIMIKAMSRLFTI